MQPKRRLAQGIFLTLFIMTPIFDWFRLDLTQGHFILFGADWTLNLTAYAQQSTTDLVLRLSLVVLLPLLALVGLFLLIAWRWGRLYCGWLCPHFLAVESINNLMKRACGKLSLWDRQTIPETRQDGSQYQRNRWWWLPTGVAIFGIAFCWAVIALSYVWPPSEVYRGLWQFNLGFYQSLFLAVVTLVFTIEFTLARHLFCRYACAVGVFQSLAWMANPKAMVVGFNGQRAKSCIGCDKSCEHACPMRLKPRTIKRKMFTCTQCFACTDACQKVQQKQHQPALLKMLSNQCALDKSQRDFGRKAAIPLTCFED